MPIESIVNTIYEKSLIINGSFNSSVLPIQYLENFSEFSSWIHQNLFKDEYVRRSELDYRLFVTDKMPTKSDNGYDTSNLNKIQSLKMIILGEIWKYCYEEQVLDNYELVYNIFDQTFRKGDLYKLE